MSCSISPDGPSGVEVVDGSGGTVGGAVVVVVWVSTVVVASVVSVVGAMLTGGAVVVGATVVVGAVVGAAVVGGAEVGGGVGVGRVESVVVGAAVVEVEPVCAANADEVGSVSAMQTASTVPTRMAVALVRALTGSLGTSRPRPRTAPRAWR